MAIAQEKQLFKKHGVDVEPRLYHDVNHALSDFNAYKLDGIMIALGDVLPISLHLPLKVPFIVDHSDGADVIIAHNSITDVQALTGERIGYTPDVYGEILTQRMLAQHNMDVEDVLLQPVYAENLLVKLNSGSVKAGVSWEPYSSEAIAAGHHIIFSSSDAPGAIMDGFVVHEKLAYDRDHDLKAFSRAWFEAVDYWKQYPEDAAKIIAKYTGINQHKITMEGIKLYSLKDNRDMYLHNHAPHSAIANAQAFVDILLSNNRLSMSPDLARLFDPSFIQQLYSFEPKHED